MLIVYKILPWLAAGLLALILKCGYDHNRRLEGESNLRDSINVARIDSLKASRSRVDTLYRPDTVRLWRQTIRLKTLVDTLLKSDTVTLTKRESVLVFVADSVLQSCKSVISLCEQRVANRDSTITAITQSRDLWKRKAEPSTITKMTTAAKWLGIGYLIRWGISK